MKTKNIFESIPDEITQEIFEDLVNGDDIRIERIISKGQTSPDSGWYEQDQNEWVIVLKGAATLVFENGEEIHLVSGDFLNIPKQVKHKVSWTDPEHVTLWLAVFYS